MIRLLICLMTAFYSIVSTASEPYPVLTVRDFYQNPDVITYISATEISPGQYDFYQCLDREFAQELACDPNPINSQPITEKQLSLALVERSLGNGISARAGQFVHIHGKELFETIKGNGRKSQVRFAAGGGLPTLMSKSLIDYIQNMPRE